MVNSWAGIPGTGSDLDTGTIPAVHGLSGHEALSHQHDLTLSLASTTDTFQHGLNLSNSDFGSVDFGSAGFDYGEPSIDPSMIFPQSVSDAGVTPSFMMPTPSNSATANTVISPDIIEPSGFSVVGQQSSSPRFSCSECGGTFSRSYDVTRHKESVHLGQGKAWCDVVGCKRSMGSGGRPFPRADKLRDHMKKAHLVPN